MLFFFKPEQSCPCPNRHGKTADQQDNKMVIERLTMSRITRRHQAHLVAKEVFDNLPTELVGDQTIPSHEE